MVRVKDYWPEVADDLTLISWSHATNSKALLEQALADSTMMIEADVSLGAENVPIMAHPPANTSDLTLQQFLESVLVSTESGKKKGIKLDFKFLEVVEPSLRQLDGLRDKLKMPLWLNADILQGPGGGGQSSLTITLILAMRFQALFVCLYRHTDTATNKTLNSRKSIKVVWPSQLISLIFASSDKQA